MCDPADRPDVYMLHNRKARIHHVCGACQESIQPGHKYVAHEGLWDGEWWRIKHCLRCYQIFQELVDVHGNDACIDLQLDCGETYEDLFGKVPPDVAALAFLSGADLQEAA